MLWLLSIVLIAAGVFGFLWSLVHDGIEAPQPTRLTSITGPVSIVALIAGAFLLAFKFLSLFPWPH